MSPRCSGLENREYGRKEMSRWPRGILYPQMLALSSPTSGSHSVGIVRLQTQATEFSLVLVLSWLLAASDPWEPVQDISLHLPTILILISWNWSWLMCDQLKKNTPWSESASELYQPSDRRLSAKWLPTFANSGCHMVSVTDPYGRILGFLDRSRYFSIR
jgi:hypothetical protein